MNELHFLIHNLSDLAPNHDRRPHCRVVDILVENWAGGQYITSNYREHGSDADRKRPLSKTETNARRRSAQRTKRQSVLIFGYPAPTFTYYRNFATMV